PQAPLRGGRAARGPGGKRLRDLATFLHECLALPAHRGREAPSPPGAPRAAQDSACIGLSLSGPLAPQFRARTCLRRRGHDLAAGRYPLGSLRDGPRREAQNVELIIRWWSASSGMSSSFARIASGAFSNPMLSPSTRLGWITWPASTFRSKESRCSRWGLESAFLLDFSRSADVTCCPPTRG